MTIEQWILLGGLIATWIGAGISMYNAQASRRHIGAQADHEGAAAVREYAAAAREYAEEVRKLKAELAALATELEKRDEVIDHLNMVIEQKSQTIGDLQEWAEKLVAQVQAKGDTPVPFKSSRRSEKAAKGA